MGMMQGESCDRGCEGGVRGEWWGPLEREGSASVVFCWLSEQKHLDGWCASLSSVCHVPKVTVLCTSTQMYFHESGT